MNKVVWFIFQEASPIGKGAYSRHYYFANELQKKGFIPKIITATFHHFQNEEKNIDGFFESSVENNISTLWLKVNRYPSAHSLRRVLAWLSFMAKLFLIPFTKQKSPDYIIVSSPSLHAVIGAQFLNRFYKKSKLILELRDIWPKTLVEVGKISKNNIIIQWMFYIEKRAYKNSNYIFSTLPYADERIKEVLGQKPFKFKCIPQGISPIIDSEKSNKKELKVEIPEDKFIIAYSGTIGASNALETLIMVAESFSIDKNNLFQFIIIGDGASLNKIKNLARNLQNVNFIPKVSKNQLPSIFKSCDVLYDSTKDVDIYKYGLSRNKWIDYMMAAKPMIVSYSGKQTIINEARNGIVVKSENVADLKKSIVTLSNYSKAELEKMGHRGLEYALKYRSFENLTKDLEEIFITC